MRQEVREVAVDLLLCRLDDLFNLWVAINILVCTLAQIHGIVDIMEDLLPLRHEDVFLDALLQQLVIYLDEIQFLVNFMCLLG